MTFSNAQAGHPQGQIKANCLSCSVNCDIWENNNTCRVGFSFGFADFSFCFALCVLLGCFVLLVSVFFLSQQKLFPCIFGFVFRLLLNPLDEKEDTYKGQISEILYNPPLILPLHVLEKVKSRT